MNVDITILFILGIPIKWSKGYVAGVNPKLLMAELTTVRPNADFKMDRQYSVESSSHQSFIPTSSYQDSRIVFPSPSDDFHESRYSQEKHEQWRDETEIRSFSTRSASSDKKPREEQLSRLRSRYPFERDDDDDDNRPIWSN